MRTLYGWPALVAVINVCPTKPRSSSFVLQDLFNVLDMHLHSGHGFQVRDDWFMPPQQVLGARGALVLLVQTLFGDGNVCFYSAGVPDVFLDDGGRVTETAVQRLLNWE